MPIAPVLMCLPICVTDRYAEPAEFVPLYPAHSIKVTSLCSPKGAGHPPERKKTTAQKSTVWLQQAFKAQVRRTAVFLFFAFKIKASGNGVRLCTFCCLVKGGGWCRCGRVKRRVDGIERTQTVRDKEQSRLQKKSMFLSLHLKAFAPLL